MDTFHRQAKHRVLSFLKDHNDGLKSLDRYNVLEELMNVQPLSKERRGYKYVIKQERKRKRDINAS